MRRALRLLAFLALQVCVVLVLLEITARIVDPAGISYYPETARLLDRMILEEPIGYRLPPGLEGRFHGVEVRTNALGMRDREVPPEKEPGEFRILMIGDSVLFGIGVAYEDSISHQLEVLANRNARDGVHYRTLNMGVPSYNTEQELVQLRQTGLSLQPDLAILFFVSNDIEPKMWVFDKRRSLAADWVQRSYALSLLFAGQRAAREMLDPAQRAARISVGSFRADHPRWRAIDESLTEIHDLLQQAGVPLLVVSAASLDNVHGELLRKVADREGFPLREISIRRDPRWADEPPDRFRNSSTDAHCNPDGCRAIATLLYERLVEERLLP